MSVVATNKTVINLPSGWLSSVGAEASGLSEVLALSIVVPSLAGQPTSARGGKGLVNAL